MMMGVGEFNNNPTNDGSNGSSNNSNHNNHNNNGIGCLNNDIPCPPLHHQAQMEGESWMVPGARPDARPLLPTAAFFMGDLRDGLPMVSSNMKPQSR